MIEARNFVEAARQRGFRWYAGVPCSFLTPFINYVLQDPSLHYLSMANEGDAVALMAGVALAGDANAPYGRGIAMMQNSGLGNAVSPLTSLTWTFRLPQLLIVTWRAQPGVADEPQHALMGPITPGMLKIMEIPWELFPTESAQVGPALDRAIAYMDQTGRPYALIMQKGSVAAHSLAAGAGAIGGRSSTTKATGVGQDTAGEGAAAGAGAGGGAGAAAGTGAMAGPATAAAAARPSREDALRAVVAQTPAESTVLLASTGFCGRELYAIADRPNHLYMVGSMGCVLPLGLGLALARPDLRVIALDGDGAALMRLGAFATVGAYGPANLWHLLLDNGVHDSTGGQATVSPRVAFADMAAACGYASSLETHELGRISAWLNERPIDGSRFARLFIRPGTPGDLPRPSVTPVAVKTRLMQHIGAPGGVH